MVAAVVPYLLAMREYKNMDPEQDDATKKTELYLSVSLLIEGIGLIGSFFFFAAAFFPPFLLPITALCGKISFGIKCTEHSSPGRHFHATVNSR